ncbi:MAG: hypothetical protein FJY07_02575 [Bacteroidetes bacterium]|nr:hypothetical protein [Bacteroidota bacterium]
MFFIVILVSFWNSQYALIEVKSDQAAGFENGQYIFIAKVDVPGIEKMTEAFGSEAICLFSKVPDLIIE